MTKKSIKDLQRVSSKFFVVLSLMFLNVAICSCTSDDDPRIDLGDYYFRFEVVDRGTLSDGEANQVMGALNAQMPTMNGYKRDEAIYVYDKQIEALRVAYSGSNDFELSFRVKLMVETSVVKSNVVKIARQGCTIQ